MITVKQGSDTRSKERTLFEGERISGMWNMQEGATFTLLVQNDDGRHVAVRMSLDDAHELKRIIERRSK